MESATNSATSAAADTIKQKALKEFLQQGREPNSVKTLVNAYRRFGIIELEPETYGFDTTDSMQNPLRPDVEATVSDLIGHLREMHTGPIAVEFMHLKDAEERQFFARVFEEFSRTKIHVNESVLALKIMLKIKAWENFVGMKFPTLKRYSSEGAESMAVFYKQLLEECAKNGIQEFIWGGAHRGRLALQTAIFSYPIGQMFRKMRGKPEFPATIDGIGDVLTHQHSHFDYETAIAENGISRVVHVSTMPNPSHLEAAMPAVIGKARGRALTKRLGDYGGTNVGQGILPVHHHGDGAFTGQGIVWESLAMSQVPHFRVGGSIHLIINNQLAFTADKSVGRSSLHCTDVAKAIDCPVIHVNAESIEKVIVAAKIAMAYRQQYRKDVFIDLNCYRKYGHNELDDPRFTQPLMYRAIDAKTESMVDIYASQLNEQKLFSHAESNQFLNEYTEKLRRELDLVDNGQLEPSSNHLNGNWHGFTQAPKAVSKWDTGVNVDLLKFIGAASVSIPEDFSIHPHLQKTHVDARLRRLTIGEIDWSTAEALAIGSALLQGFDVRLSGQDVGRGTFSHRHAMLVCQETDRVHIPLNAISEEQKHFLEIANSPLTEAAVLGFEYGFSIEHPRRLVIWEAQFGDFYNGAQVQIDTMIASGESKWLLQTGLIMLLPHGFDGAGPDHSSAHIERFLSLTDSREDQLPVDGDYVNLQVANPTTSAQYFHLLRRQIITPYRKPLLIITPKLLLRHSFTVSRMSDFGEGQTFQPVLFDPRIQDTNAIKKVILCSGKHALTLMDECQKRDITDVAIVRMEGICPFPVDDLCAIFRQFPNAKSFVWSQEETRNAGCWPFVQSRFRNAFGISLQYAGRPELAWMATPIAEIHKNEMDDVLKKAFSM